MRTALLSVAGAAMVLAACGGGSSGDSGAAEPVDAAPAEAPAPGDAAGRPVALAAGGTVDLDSFAGQDVLLWFWAPW